MRRLVLLVAFASACEESDDGTSASTIAPTSMGSTASMTTDPTDAGTSTEGGSESEASSGAPLPGACEERSDCMLVDDCCTCEAMHVDAEVPVGSPGTELEFAL